MSKWHVFNTPTTTTSTANDRCGTVSNEYTAPEITSNSLRSLLSSSKPQNCLKRNVFLLLAGLILMEIRCVGIYFPSSFFFDFRLFLRGKLLLGIFVFLLFFVILFSFPRATDSHAVENFFACHNLIKKPVSICNLLQRRHTNLY